MEKNPHLILGVSADATEAQITEAHALLRAQYSEKLLLPGEAGDKAAAMLSKLDQARTEALEACRVRSAVSQYGSLYGGVEAALRANDLGSAQQQLDNMTYHDAEWHYLQSAVYHKRGWPAESKKQLELAINLQPENGKYTNALAQLNYEAGIAQNMRGHYGPHGGVPGQNPHMYGHDPRAGYPPPDMNEPNAADTCCQTCACLICLDCCCRAGC